MTKTPLGISVALVSVVLLGQTLTARPQYLATFQADPLRRTDLDGCVVCHNDPKGGGPRNDFGAAFEAAGRQITPMVRANFPDRFGYVSTRLADGTAVYFSDPKNQIIVIEQAGQKNLLDLASLRARPAAEKLPPAENRMSFFVTSKNPGKGGHLSGLAGADRHCQALAEAAGFGDRTWRAYLSTSYQGKPAVNAGDRVGTGPWFNAKGIMVARGIADLHANGGKISKELALDETGKPVASGLILTGSNPDGTAAVDQNCNNWTSPAEGKAMLGSLERQGSDSWNSGKQAPSCSPDAFKSAGAEGLFYCFAIR